MELLFRYTYENVNTKETTVKYRNEYRKDLGTILGENHRLVAIDQYIGRDDCNGVKIFNNDTIEYKHNNITVQWWRDRNHRAEIEAYVKKERGNMETIRDIVKFDRGQYTLGYPNMLTDISFPNKIEKRKSGNSCDYIIIYESFTVASSQIQQGI